MLAKKISSTQAQNNFGRLLDDVNHSRALYIIERRRIPQAIVINLDDFLHLLSEQSESERQYVSEIIAKIRPKVSPGQILEPLTE